MPYTAKQERFFHARGIKHSHDKPIRKPIKKSNKTKLDKVRNQ